MRARPAIERFFEKLVGVDFGGCWNWGAYKDKLGYGHFWPVHRPGVLAHRFSWEIHNGPIPDGLFVCHKCDNPPCVNPDHLFLGSAKDNSQDMVAKGRAGRVDPEKNGGGGKLKRRDVREIRDLWSVMSRQQLADLYHVTHGMIGHIVKNRVWKGV